MKQRKGFVTNSSSSSYVCDVCGRTDSGYDSSAEDCGFHECSEGHTYCTREAVSIREAITEKGAAEFMNLIAADAINGHESGFIDLLAQLVQAVMEKDYDQVESEIETLRSEDFFSYLYPRVFCPICSGKEVSRDQFLAYATAVLGYNTYGEAKEAILTRFTSPEEIDAEIKRLRKKETRA